MAELSPMFFTISSLSGKGIQPLLWEIKERLFSEEKTI
jgi:hypothetical protein